jgi:hypothetical protein
VAIASVAEQAPTNVGAASGSCNGAGPLGQHCGQCRICYGAGNLWRGQRRFGGGYCHRHLACLAVLPERRALQRSPAFRAA